MMSWMQKLVMAATGAAALVACGAMQAQTRPPITGISHMCVYASDMSASSQFYEHILGATRGADPQDAQGARFYFSPEQFVEVLPLPADQGLSRMNCVSFATTNARQLAAYLKAHDVETSEVHKEPGGSLWFDTKDPEGNRVQFMEQHGPRVAITSDPISHHMIHMGYLVHSRDAENKFYRDLLGFRPYWYGAMHEGHTDWVSLQVPDGHDWLEYMLVGGNSDVDPDHIDAHEMGVLDHFSLGVKNMEATVTALVNEGRWVGRHDGPQMGRDGKWQANLYDPDGTRVELMEFQPSAKPCCSEFTAASPVQ